MKYNVAKAAAIPMVALSGYAAQAAPEPVVPTNSLFFGTLEEVSSTSAPSGSQGMSYNPGTSAFTYTGLDDAGFINGEHSTINGGSFVSTSNSGFAGVNLDLAGDTTLGNSTTGEFSLYNPGLNTVNTIFDMGAGINYTGLTDFVLPNDANTHYFLLGGEQSGNAVLQLISSSDNNVTFQNQGTIDLPTNFYNLEDVTVKVESTDTTLADIDYNVLVMEEAPFSPADFQEEYEPQLRNVKFKLNQTIVPEPSTTALIGLGGLAGLLRRKRN